MNHLHRFLKNPLARGMAIVLSLTALTSVSRATPYATSLTNSAGVVSFRLNESADGVKVISSSGAVTNDLGPLPKGLTVTNLGISGVYKVQVAKSGGSGWQSGVINQISVDTNSFVKFINQRGIAVNKNTNSPYFGRIYVSVSAGGTVASNEFNLGSRTVGEGFYLLNADQTDALGEGDTARTGGLVFDSSAASDNIESPYRLFIGPDDKLYISDFSTNNGGLFVTDPNVATNSTATNVLDGIGGQFPVTSSRTHGSINSCWVEGSLAGGDLTIYAGDRDLQTDPDITTVTEVNSAWLYNINSGPLPYTGLPTKYFSYGIGFAIQVAKIERGPDGKWYASNRRADNGTTAGIFVRSADGTTALWNSLTAWRTNINDPAAFDTEFTEMRGFAVSPDGRYLVGLKANTNALKILPLESGIPNITNLITIPTTPATTTGRDVCFDIAGNIYTVSSGQQMLRIYAPGGNTVATSGSDGTFQIFRAGGDVSVTTTTNKIYETGSTTGSFVISRTGATTDPLTVFYGLSGTASNTDDYSTLSGSVTLQSGASSTNVTVVPVDDAIAEFSETVVLTLSNNNNYSLVPPSSATMTIIDNETPQLEITNLSTGMYERTNDYAQFQITRLGNTNAASFNVNLSFSGPAILNTDFYVDNPVTFNPGEVTKTFKIYPINDTLVNSNLTLTCSLAAGTGYTVGSPGTSGTVTIFNSTLPTEVVLFSDNFNVDSSASWKLIYGSITNYSDYTVLWAFDYAALLGIPKAPHSASDTLGVFMNVNKLDGTPAGAAVNLYPFGQNFSGDYALRCDMYLIDALGGSATEYALFGINHSGNKTNWFRGGGSTGNLPGGVNLSGTNWDFDGLFFDIETDGNASASDYALWSSPTITNSPAFSGPNPTRLKNAGLTPFTGLFKNPPWAVTGLPSNTNNSPNAIWADVEVSQMNGVVTLKVNNTTILTYTNATTYTSGNIMLGYEDAFDSIGPGGIGTGAGVVFDNVRVVRVGDLKITGKTIVGSNLQLDFTDYVGLGGPYTLKSTTTVSTNSADYTTVGSATFTTNSLGVYRVTTPYDSAANAKHYYRLSR